MVALFYILVLLTTALNLCTFHSEKVYVMRKGITPQQQQYIKTILQNKSTPDYMRDRVKTIIHQHYFHWVRSVYMEVDPKIFIASKINTVRTKRSNEIYQYALLGYVKALSRYNGIVPFHSYAEKYIKGEMMRGLKETSLVTTYSRTKYIKTDNPLIISMKDYVDKGWKGENERQDESKSIQDTISQVATPEEKRLFYYRYDVATRKKIKSIKEVCTYMCFSDETYRKRMNKLKTKITSHNPHFS